MLEAYVRAFSKTVTDASGKDTDCAQGLEPFSRQLLAFETTVFHTALSQVLEGDGPQITLVDEPMTDEAVQLAKDMDALKKQAGKERAAVAVEPMPAI